MADQVLQADVDNVSFIDEALNSIEVFPASNIDLEKLEEEMNMLEMIYCHEQMDQIEDSRMRSPSFFQISASIYDLCTWWRERNDQAELHMAILFTDYLDSLEMEAYRNSEMTVDWPLERYVYDIENNYIAPFLNKYSFYFTLMPSFVKPDMFIVLGFPTLGRTHFMLFNKTCLNQFAMIRVE